MRPVWRIPSIVEQMNPFTSSLPTYPPQKKGALFAPPIATEEKRSNVLPKSLHPFAVETYIETFALLFLGDAQANDHVDDLEDDEAAHAAVDQRRENRTELHQHIGVRFADVL